MVLCRLPCLCFLPFLCFALCLPLACFACLPLADLLALLDFGLSLPLSGIELAGAVSTTAGFSVVADGGAKVDTQGQKEIAQSLNNMMDAWARRESRQGGVLHKLARG